MEELPGMREKESEPSVCRPSETGLDTGRRVNVPTTPSPGVLPGSSLHRRQSAGAETVLLSEDDGLGSQPGREVSRTNPRSDLPVSRPSTRV